MKTKLFSILLVVSMIASLAVAMIPAAPVYAEGGGQQVWYITSGSNLASTPDVSTGSIQVEAGDYVQTTLTATDAVTITAGDWRGHIDLSSPYSGVGQIRIGIYGGTFSGLGTLDLTSGPYSSSIDFSLTLGVMELIAGQTIALEFQNTQPMNIATGGAASYIISPPSSQAFPNPSMTTTYGLTMSATQGGSANPSASSTPYPYFANTVVPISATPATDYLFTGWSGGLTSTTNPTTVLMDTNKAITANFALDAPIYLDPPTVAAIPVNNTFTMDIKTSVLAGQQISGVQAFLQFNPAKLQVVDASGDAGVQIAPATDLPDVVTNTVDNLNGTINFASTNNGGPFPTGPFTLATITFQAIAETGTGTTAVEFLFSSSNVTIVDNLGFPVSGTHGDATIRVVTLVTLDVSVSLQGARSAAGYVVPLTIKLFTPDTPPVNVLTATPVYEWTLTTDMVTVGQNSYAAAQMTELISDTYDVTVVSEHTLLNVMRRRRPYKFSDIP